MSYENKSAPAGYGDALGINSRFDRVERTDNSLSPNRSKALAAALDYAARGWEVFPLLFIGKTKKSHKAAEHSNGRKWGKTKDPEEINKDFARWPDAGIGIPTGKDNGIFIVEADTLKGHNVDGIATLRALEAEHGPFRRLRRGPGQTRAELHH